MSVKMRPQVIPAIKAKLDRSLAEKAVLIEVKAKARVPLKNGLLQNSGSSRRIGFGRFRVEFDKEYASYQEHGMRHDGTHVVHHYTTPGTGKQYLERSAREVIGLPFGKVTR